MTAPLPAARLKEIEALIRGRFTLEAEACRDLLAELRRREWQPMGLQGFIRWLMEEQRESMDLDGGSLQDALVKHGLLLERPATAEDCAEEWAQEYGYEVGDTMLDWTPALRDLLNEEPPA